MGLSMRQKKAVTKEMAQRYRRASKTVKAGMLDELCALTGWTRRHACRTLKAALHPVTPRTPPRRSSTYGPDVLKPLQKIWATLDAPCGKRLAPFMDEIVPVMERFGELVLTKEQKQKLLSISASTIDRKLAPDRSRLQVAGRGRGGTKPGSLLKHQVAIRTFSDWDDARPGFVELDLVAHDGGNPRGDYAQTLDLTDVASGWSEPRAVKNKAQRWVFEALTDIEQTLPFPLAGIDSDNGSEFINYHLVAYCEQKKITFTRTRPYRKNDNCFIEQKNWTVVRQNVGYLRYDTDREVALLNELYGHLRLYVNFFQPQMKLVEKTRQGSKVKKRYDVPKTPYRRLLASKQVSAAAKANLTRQYKELNPVELKRQIARCQDRLLKLSKNKSQLPKKKEVKPATASRTFSMRQRRAG